MPANTLCGTDKSHGVYHCFNDDAMMTPAHGCSGISYQGCQDVIRSVRSPQTADLVQKLRYLASPPSQNNCSRCCDTFNWYCKAT
eukprot:2974046-Amphidinium_carterae.1